MSWVAVGAAATTVVGGALLNKGGSGSGGSDLQGEIAADQWNRYKTMYSPLEESYVKEAQNYDSPENFVKAAGDANATVTSEFGKARDRLTRTPGLDTSTPGYAASLIGLDSAQAAQGAVSQNAARQKVKDTAWARKSDALNLGKGMQAGAVSAANSAAQIQQMGLNNSLNAAGALGRVSDRVISSPKVQGWLSQAGGGTTQTINPNSGEYLGSLEF